MTDFSTIVAAPIRYKAGETVYEVSPLNLNDWGAFLKFVQMMPYETIKALDVPQSEKHAVLRECVNKPVLFFSKQHLGALASFEGMRQLAWLSLRHKHADISLGVINSFDLTTLTELVEVVSLLSNPPDDEDSKKKLAEVVLPFLKEKGRLVAS